MTFNPEESIDFNGNTGPFIQYTYARIPAILRNSSRSWYQDSCHTRWALTPIVKEEGLIQMLTDFTAVVNMLVTTTTRVSLPTTAYD